MAEGIKESPQMDTIQACKYIMVMIESPPDVEVHDIVVMNRFDMTNKF